MEEFPVVKTLIGVLEKRSRVILHSGVSYRLGRIVVRVCPPPLIPLPNSKKDANLIAREDMPISRRLTLRGSQTVGVGVVGQHESNACSEGKRERGRRVVVGGEIRHVVLDGMG